MVRITNVVVKFLRLKRGFAHVIGYTTGYTERIKLACKFSSLSRLPKFPEVNLQRVKYRTLLLTTYER